MQHAICTTAWGQNCSPRAITPALWLHIACGTRRYAIAYTYSTAHEQLNTLVRESRESLASSVVGSRETNWLHSREHWATLARTLGYTRENTGLHSRDTWLHSRGHLATLARTISYTRELHSRGHLATVTFARPLG